MAIVREDVVKLNFEVGDKALGKVDQGITNLVKSAGSMSLKVGKFAAKSIATATAAGVAGLGALGTQAMKTYADYEQLVGGVDTLFGNGGKSVDEFAKSISGSTAEIKAFQKANGLAVDGIAGPKTMAAIQKQYDAMADVPKKVIKNANDAYKTAGMSANEYMSTVTSFSASLISSLGGDTMKAASYADRAIVDMADNANKMGTDISSIQDAYQGFAKQNYTMLDNLKLGYGGTKSEMERLLKDAEKLTGKKFDVSNFADITEAIHAIQTEMGITGTTAKEASSTIQGSALAMKAAWTNFLGGMVDPTQDFDQLVNNLVDSVVTFAKNIIPKIRQLTPRLVRGLTEITKSIGKEFPGMLMEIAPDLISGGVELVRSLFTAIVENAPMFKNAGLELIKAVYKGLTGQEMPTGMFDSLKAKIDSVVEAARKILAAFGDVAVTIWNDLKPAFEWIGTVTLDAFVWLGDNINWLLPILKNLLAAFLAFKAVQKVKGIVSGFMALFSKGGGLLGGGGGADGAGGGGGLFSGFANIKPTTILKGMANLAIIIGGLAALAAVIAWAAPHIAQLSDGQSIAETLAVMTAVGLLGTGMTKLAASVGNIPVATVAKGLANIAIIMGGLALVTVVLGYVAKLDIDIVETLKLVGLIGVVGLVGSALAGLAGLIGAIPVPVVLNGLANIALALGGFTAIVEAFGLLSAIPGFNEFLTKGGQVLTELCGIIGEMAGSIIGGIGEGITNSLPGIGENISAFAASLEPAVATFSGMNFDGLKNFASAFGEFILVMTGEKIASWFTGGIDYAKIGSDLTALTTNGAGFFTAVEGISDTAFANASKLFECLNGIGLLPNSGGVVGWFKGEVDYAAIATGLTALAGTSGFFTMAESISETAFTNATKLFECLNGIGLLPNSGGIAQWFTGTVDYQAIADGVAILAGADMIGALTAISNIPTTAYTGLTAMFDALAGITAMPKEGGIFQWFTGDSTAGLTSVAGELPGVATNIAAFFTNLGGRTDFSPIKNLFDTLSNINIDSDVAEKGFWSGVSQMGSMGTGLADFANNAAPFFTAVQSNPPETIKAFLEAVGSAGGLPEQLTGLNGTVGTAFSTLASTVDTHMTTMRTKVTDGMNAIATAIASVDLNSTVGTAFSTLASTVTISMSGIIAAVESGMSSIASAAESSMTIVNARIGDSMLSIAAAVESNMTVATAKITTDMLSIVSAVESNMTATTLKISDSMTGIASTIETNMATAKDRIVDDMAGILKATNTSMTAIKNSVSTGMKNVVSAVKSVNLYNTGANMMLGLAKGISSKRSSVLSAARSIANAVKSTINNALDIHSPSRVLFETGTFTGQGLELGMQSTIPDIRETANEMGRTAIPYGGNYSPEGSATYYSNERSEVTTISPVFNLTVTGTTDDRATARRVKRYVSEAIAETFASMERKGRVLREV